MPTKYLLIDDESAKHVQLQEHFGDAITIDYRAPTKLEDLMAVIGQWVADQPASQRIGVLLDWKLRDGAAANAGGQIPRAPTIAQETRSRATDGTFRALPIVIISSLERMASAWNADSTAHDLFDFQILSDRLENEAYKAEAKAKLLAFADGYALLDAKLKDATPPTLDSLLGWPAHGTPTNSFDARIIADFDEGSGDDLGARAAAGGTLELGNAVQRRSVHEYVRFVVRELLETPGPLIDEARLAALLGTDADGTKSPDWRTLLERDLTGGQYRGPLASSYGRWWLSWVEDWWKRTVDDPRSSRAYEASERVQRIVAATRLARLVAAEPIAEGYSRRYTTICEVYRRPLDPVNGIRLRTREPKPWQATRFASEEAVKLRKHREFWTIHPSDIARARELQQPE